MAIETLAELFRYELSMALDAERKSSKILPLLAGTSDNEQVQTQLRLHETETIQQIHNIEQCFQILKARPDNVVCEVPKAMKVELHMFMEHSQSNAMLTEFILDAMVKMKQFEIACYQILIQKAYLLEHETCVRLLQQNLLQEEVMIQRVHQAIKQ